MFSGLDSKLKLEVVNSSPSRSTNGVGSSSIHQQQQQTPSSSSSNFHLPELKPVINNNNGNHHDGANESQNVSTEEEISAYDRQQQQIEIAIAAAINGGSITSPFRESDGGGGASSSSFTSSNDEFLHRLVNAVRREPCLYNPNDEHHGNKHSSAQYRAAVWQRLVKELNYHEDAHSLQTQWKRLRERYVRERRRKAAKDFFDPLTGGVSSVKNFHLMHWIDEFLPDISNNQSSSSNSSNNVSMHLPGTSISDRQQHQQQQYFEPLNNGFGNIGICKSSLNGPSTSTIGTKKNESTNGSPSSTSSETSTISGGGGQQQQIILPNLRHQIKSEINGGSAFYSTGKANQLMYKLREELGLRMPPVIGLVNNIGQEQQHQQHLNISPHQLQMPTETLRPISAECYQQIGILPQQQHSIQDIQNDYFHQQQQPSSSSSATNEAAISSPYLNRRKRSALDSLMLLQQQQSTNNERILQRNNNSRTKQEQQQQQIIAESEHLLIQQQQQQQIPSIALAIHNNQQQQQHHLLSPHQAPSVHSIRSSNSNSSTSLQQQQNNLLLPSTSSTITVGQQQQQASSSTTNTTIIPQQQQQQLFQQQEEIVENEEGNFIEMIVRHLKNLNEDEKVVTKMNIQRILMDARFGRGACVRMFNDELAMEQQRQQQQHLQQ